MGGRLPQPSESILIQGHRSNISENATQSLVVDVPHQESFPDTYALFVRLRGREQEHARYRLHTQCIVNLRTGEQEDKLSFISIPSLYQSFDEKNNKLGCPEATRATIGYVDCRIVAAFPLAKGDGPLNHIHNILEQKLLLFSVNHLSISSSVV